ncbi:MAG: leucine-rich repeat protein [Christensenellales bacterium]|jgi:hypothetical protein
MKKKIISIFVLVMIVLLALTLVACDEDENTCKIAWVNDDGTVLQYDKAVEKGTMPEYKGEEPRKPDDGSFVYRFIGWSPEVVEATVSTVYIAEYEKVDRFYTVTWKNEDGSVLKVDNNVYFGQKLKYSGPVPTKESTETLNFIHTGWSPSVVPVTHNATYTAIFSGMQRYCKVTWVDTAQFEPGTTKYKELYSEIVESGSTPIYAGAELSKPDNINSGTKYIFDQWDPMPTRITKDTVFTSRYAEAYDTLWYNYYNSPEVLKTARFKKEIKDTPSGYKKSIIPNYTNYDEVDPAISEDSGYTYTFRDWFSNDESDIWNDLVWGPNSLRKTMEREYLATYDCVPKNNNQCDISKFLYELNDDCYYYPSCTITGYIGEVPIDLYIPAWIDGYIVTNIWPEAFMDNIRIQSLYIGDNIRTIGQDAFNGCVNLHTIYFGENMVDIGIRMFEGCTSLHNLDIPKQIKKIRESAFKDCTNLLSVNFPDMLEEIASGAFHGCKGLTTVSIPDKVELVDGFSECISLRTVYLGKGAVGIAQHCFSGDTKLQNINLSSSNVKHIGSWAFKDCTSFTTLNCPATLITIGESAFENCINLTRVDFNGTIPQFEIIRKYAFYGCEKLRSLSIPSSVLIIERAIVAGCDELMHLSVGHGNNKYKSENNMIIDQERGMIVAGCCGSGAIPTNSNIKIIGWEAFLKCRKFNLNKALIIPPNIKEVRENAFAGCSGIRSHAHSQSGANHDESCVMSVFVPKDCVFETGAFSLDDYLDPSEDKHFCIYIDHDVSNLTRDDEGFATYYTQYCVTYHYRCECADPANFPPGPLGTAYMYWHGDYVLWTGDECFPPQGN